MTKIKKAKPKKTRDWNAVDAHGRNSQGAHKDRKKADDKAKCRKSKRKKQDD